MKPTETVSPNIIMNPPSLLVPFVIGLNISLTSQNQTNVHKNFPVDEDEGGVDDIQDQSNALIQEFAEGLNDAFNTGFSDRLGPLGAPHTHQHTHAQVGPYALQAHNYLLYNAIKL